MFCRQNRPIPLHVPNHSDICKKHQKYREIMMFDLIGSFFLSKSFLTDDSDRDFRIRLFLAIYYYSNINKQGV